MLYQPRGDRIFFVFSCALRPVASVATLPVLDNTASAGPSVPGCQTLPRRGPGEKSLLLSRKRTHRTVASLRCLWKPPTTTLSTLLQLILGGRKRQNAATSGQHNWQQVRGKTKDTLPRGCRRKPDSSPSSEYLQLNSATSLTHSSLLTE